MSLENHKERKPFQRRIVAVAESMLTRLKKTLILIYMSTVPAWAQTAPATDVSPVTLRQCYEWAQAQSEDLRIRNEEVEQSKARGKAALAAALPDVGWQLTDTWQQPSGVEKLEAKGFTGFVEKEQVESKFTARQALFSGLREFSAYKGSKYESERNRLRLERAERELFEKTAVAFYAVVGYETDRANTLSAYELAEDRVKELRDFLRLGKARESEVFTSRARSAALKGELDQIQGNLFAARQELSYLTGRDLAGTPVIDQEPVPSSAPDLENVLSRARERSDLRAQRADLEARRLVIRYERGNYWPSADLEGNYYTKRATFLKDVDWDVILTVDVPLFKGGATSAAVKEAMSQYRQSLFTLQQMERWVAHEAKRTHGELAAAVLEAQSMREAAESARRSYDSLQREYRLGLVTNLDVLQALDFLQEQQSARDEAQLKAKRLLVRLKVATEELP